MLIDIFDLNKKNHDFFKKVMIFASPEVLTMLWIHMDAEYFKKLAESMPNRLGKVIQAKGHMTKY